MSPTNSPSRSKSLPASRPTWQSWLNRNWWVGVIGLGVVLVLGVVALYHPSTSSSPVGAHLHSLVLDPAHPGTLMVGGHGGAEMSRDGGRTLQPISDLSGFDAMASSIATDGKHEVVSGHYGLRVSDDGGNHWIDRTATLPWSDTHAVGLDPSQPTHLTAFFVDVGVFSSTDFGVTWQLVGGQSLQLMGPILVQPGSTQLMALDMASGGVVLSNDGGKTWTSGAQMQAAWLAQDPNTPSHILAVTGSGMVLSTDFGHNWQPVQSPSDVAAAAIGADGTWYSAALQISAVTIFVSHDHGQSWQAVTSA